jgi:CRP-like cAMP-binding protein
MIFQDGTSGHTQGDSIMVDVNAILDSIYQAVQDNSLFGDLLSKEDREFLLQNGLVRSVADGEVLCEQNQRDNRVFIIITGAMTVTENVNGKKVSLGTLGKGEIFGEIAALFMTPRIATVTATRPSVVLEIPGDMLEQLIMGNKTIRDAVFKRYRERTLETTLRGVSIFAGLSNDDIKKLCNEATLISARKGELLIREGEQGDGMYILKHGQARVFISTMGGRELNIALLRSGDYFGEQSLLTGAPRSASVAALDQVEAVFLGRAEFLNFIQAHEEVRERIDGIAYERKRQTEQARCMPETKEAVEDILQTIQDVLSSES